MEILFGKIEFFENQAVIYDLECRMESLGDHQKLENIAKDLIEKEYYSEYIIPLKFKGKIIMAQE